MNKIKILVSAHKDVYVPENILLQPIQAGAALAEKRLPGMLHDDEGQQISGKNKAYCELTVQYWAWKNLEADYYGFFHYRRYLDFSKEYPLRTQKGYRIAGSGRYAGREGLTECRRYSGRRHLTGHRRLTGDGYFTSRVAPYKEADSIRKDLSAYGLDESNMRRIIEKYDVVTVLGERMNVTVYQQYCQFHSGEDLDGAIRILKEKYPRYAEACDLYMNSKYIYFCNMYVMKRKYFYAYMEWLFPILEEFEKEKDFSGYSERELRVIGFLAERLFGVYYTQLKRKQEAKCCELGYVIFHDTQPGQIVHPYFGKDSVNLVSASNHSFAPYLGVMLQSVMEHADSGKKYDIVILHTDISQEYQKILAKAADGKPHIQIRFCDVSDALAGIDLPVRHHISVETYFRYFILDFMPEYEKVLWLDADLVVLQDVGELYRTQMHHYCVAAVLDLDLIGTYRTDQQVKKYIDRKLGIRDPYYYFQAGVMLLNLTQIRKRYMAEDLVRMSMKYPWHMLDQDVLNRALQGSCMELDQKWNVVMDWQYGGRRRTDLLKNAPYELWSRYLSAREAPAVIHYAGGWKPWTMPDCDFAQFFWDYARRSPFYEVILYSRIPDAGFHLSAKADSMRSFRLKPTRLSVAVDMRKVNRILPPGSLRRRIVRTVCGKFL